MQRLLNTISTFDFPPFLIQTALCLLLTTFSGGGHAGQVKATVVFGTGVTLKDFNLALADEGSINGGAKANVIWTDHKKAASTKKVGATGATGTASRMGGGTLSSAYTNWSVKKSGPNGRIVDVDAVGFVEAFNNKPRAGWAEIYIDDPFDFRNAANNPFDLSYSFDSEFKIQALGEETEANVFIEAGSTIPSLENFFTLSMGLSGATPDNLFIDFNSNPLLGLNDSLIEDNILSFVAYDALNATYSMTSELAYLDLRVITPSNQDQVSFYWNADGKVFLSPVPEPSSISLFFLGLLVTALSLRKKLCFSVFRQEVFAPS